MLIAPRAGAYLRILVLAVTVLVLMMGAVFFPFLQLRVAGLRSEAAAFDAAPRLCQERDGAVRRRDGGLNVVATLNPGPAAVTFALSVAFTMLSAKSFDSRMIWDRAE